MLDEPVLGSKEEPVQIGVLGTGTVGRSIAGKLVALGHEVRMGSRTPDNENAAAWVRSAGDGASHGTFDDAASFGQLVFNCTAGDASIAALRGAGEENLAGKVLVDVSNALDFSQGPPPSLFVTTKESLGEQIQAAFPDARVVKTLHTVNADVMVDPSLVPGEHDMFVCGNDAAAKEEVTTLLESFGWHRERILDLGDITSARGTEMYVVLWLRLWGATGTFHFNIHVVR
jgi:8-hydroxy-5-deazaflavin:NADPH oxidoreductase